MRRGTSLRHARASARRRPCDDHGCEPVVGRACPHCGSAMVFAACSGCGDAMAVCDRYDPIVAFDCFVQADGRCARCRSGGAGLSRGGEFMRRANAPDGFCLCLACGHESFAALCVVRGCSRRFVVCPRCPDEYDRYVETGGRCTYCRVQ